MNSNLNKYSSHITRPKSQGASQAMLYATGLSESDLEKAQVGISSVWFEGNPCNMHLLDLAAKVKEGVVAAGLVGMRFNTIGVSDGISMGTDGMSFSLQSRDLIADSIETTMGGQWYDANISLPGCDKNMPGCIIAMGRLNRPSLVVYGGTIHAGMLERENWMSFPRSRVTANSFREISTKPGASRSFNSHVPAPGHAAACTRRTPWRPPSKCWGCRCPYSSSTPAEDPLKLDECFRAGAAIRNLLAT